MFLINNALVYGNRARNCPVFFKQLKKVAGFSAIGEITENDFSTTIMPAVKELVHKTGKLNYLLLLDTSLKNFTAGAWMKDALMGIKHIIKWNRAAIVSDVDAIRNFTNIFSYFIPGKFKGFEHKDYREAVDWVSEKVK